MNARSSPAALRNRGPILEVLTRVLPARGLVLEIASGTGEHAVFFARGLPAIEWQPSDVDAEALESIAARREAEPSPNLRAPLPLDVCAAAWPIARADAVFCANMIHASPPETTPGLLRGAARVLEEGGVLVTYGPYRIGGAHTAESNVEFDAWLEGRDPRWGVRDLEVVVEVAAGAGLVLEERVPMPANNYVLVFRKGAAAPSRGTG